MNNFSKVAEIFPQVLEVENTPDILDFVVPEKGFLLWPVIRYTVLTSCLEHFFPGNYFFPKAALAETSRSRYSLFFKTLLQCVPPWPKRKIWICAAVGSAYYKIKNGRLYNHYIEPFAEVMPEHTLLVDFSHGPEFIPPTPAYPIRRTAPINLVAGKLTRYRTVPQAEKNVTECIKFIKNRIKTVLGVDLPSTNYAQWNETLLHYCKRSWIEYSVYSKLITSSTPSLFIFEGLLYGGLGYIVRLCKELGITVGDLQHGLIHPRQPALNWADTLVNDVRLQRESSDIYFTYGEYWHQFFKACGTPIAVGNPWFSQFQSIGSEKSTSSILFTLSIYYDEFLPFIAKVLESFPEREVVLRPHPSEWSVFEQSKIRHLEGVTIDYNKNIYETFSRVHTAIGTFSTSLYEAAALGKRVLLRSLDPDAYVSNHFFEFFDTPEELVEKLQHTDWAPLEDVYDVFFARNWEENYKNAVAQILSN